MTCGRRRESGLAVDIHDRQDYRCAFWAEAAVTSGASEVCKSASSAEDAEEVRGV